MKLRSKRVIVLFGIFVVFMLNGCHSPYAQLEEVQTALPTPKDTVLLDSVTEQTSGSQDACHFTHFTNLYGTSLSFEMVSEFYEDWLQNDGWTRIYPSWLPEGMPIFRKEDEFQLTIDSSETAIGFTFNDLDNQQLELYTTVYTVTVTYADRIARRTCPFPAP